MLFNLFLRVLILLKFDSDCLRNESSFARAFTAPLFINSVLIPFSASLISVEDFVSLCIPLCHSHTSRVLFVQNPVAFESLFRKPASKVSNL